MFFSRDVALSSFLHSFIFFSSFFLSSVFLSSVFLSSSSSSSSSPLTYGLCSQHFPPSPRLLHRSIVAEGLESLRSVRGPGTLGLGRVGILLNEDLCFADKV